jgi:hypothetical protein
MSAVAGRRAVVVGVRLGRLPVRAEEVVAMVVVAVVMVAGVVEMGVATVAATAVVGMVVPSRTRLFS